MDLLLTSSGGVECDPTQEVCLDLLRTPMARLHNTAWKIRLIFYREIQECIDNGGQCSVTFYYPFKLLVENWVGDSQEIEGIMNLIKLAVTRAPTISHALVDARVGLTKLMGLGSRGARVWSIGLLIFAYMF